MTRPSTSAPQCTKLKWNCTQVNCGNHCRIPCEECKSGTIPLIQPGYIIKYPPSLLKN